MIHTLIFYLFFSFFCCKRVLRYLRYFQQEDYDKNRFLKWYYDHNAFDKRGSAISAITFILLSATNIIWFSIFGSIALFTLALIEENPLTSGKLKLVLTKRAKRIFSVACIETLLCLSFFLSVTYHTPHITWLISILVIQAIPFLLVLAIWLLKLDENRRQNHFLQQAKIRVQTIDPFIIGITGSYGKTSTKLALAEILQLTLGPTFYPGKGVNTPMGITREIRNHLKKGHQYAVVEMAAYKKGSIKRLCELTPPKAGIITCIGKAHLERFKTQDEILKTKQELAEAIPDYGILICNGNNEGAYKIAKKNPKKTTLLYGFDPTHTKYDLNITSWSIVDNKMTFTFHWQDKLYSGFTYLLGKAHLENIAAAFLMAASLGANPDLVIAEIANLEPVDNRLTLSVHDNITYLNDAYNSNPEGFQSALDVLAKIKSKRRLIMTPGMIELDKEQDKQNERLGKKASQICDMAIIVGNTNKKALIKGLQSGGMPESKVLTSTNRQKAFEILKENTTAGDAVLIENDLTDIYETKVRF